MIELKPSDYLARILEKGKKLPEGTVKTWGKHSYKKVSGKWIKQAKGRKQTDESSHEYFMHNRAGGGGKVSNKKGQRQYKKYSDKELKRFKKQGMDAVELDALVSGKAHIDKKGHFQYKENEGSKAKTKMQVGGGVDKDIKEVYNEVKDKPKMKGASLNDLAYEVALQFATPPSQIKIKEVLTKLMTSHVKGVSGKGVAKLSENYKGEKLLKVPGFNIDVKNKKLFPLDSTVKDAVITTTETAEENLDEGINSIDEMLEEVEANIEDTKVELEEDGELSEKYDLFEVELSEAQRKYAKQEISNWRKEAKSRKLKKSIPSMPGVKQMEQVQKPKKVVPQEVKKFIEDIEAAFKLIDSSVADLCAQRGVESCAELLASYKKFKDDFIWKLNDEINYPSSSNEPKEVGSSDDYNKSRIRTSSIKLNYK